MLRSFKGFAAGLAAEVARGSVTEAFQRGEGWAFDRIYQRYQQPILKYIRQRIRSLEVAEELMQETFVKAFRSHSMFKPDGSLSAWLFTIARNTALDWIRAHQKSEDARESPGPESVGSFWEDFPCRLPSIESLLERADQVRAFKRLVRGLTRLQRRVLWLRVVHQLPYRDIANRLGISLSSVKCLMYRVRQLVSHQDWGHELQAFI